MDDEFSGFIFFENMKIRPVTDNLAGPESKLLAFVGFISMRQEKGSIDNLNQLKEQPKRSWIKIGSGPFIPVEDPLFKDLEIFKKDDGYEVLIYFAVKKVI